MSLVSQAVGNKRRRVDDSDSDDDDDGEGFIKILNWKYGAKYMKSRSVSRYSIYWDRDPTFKEVLAGLPLPTMQCEFPIINSSKVETSLPGTCHYFTISLQHINLEDEMSSIVDGKNIWETEQPIFKYLFVETDWEKKKKKSDENAQAYLNQLAEKTKQVKDYYLSPSNFPGTNKFSIISVDGCARNNDGGERRLCTLQVLVPSRLAVIPSSSEYAQKTWCISELKKLGDALRGFGIDVRDFLQSETLDDNGQVELRF